MKFSIFHVPSSAGPGDDSAVIDTVIEESLLADELGFAAIWLPEHHFTGYSPSGSDPFMLASYLAPQIKQARLGFAIVVLPLNNPVRMVERINLMDNLTKGRAIFGLGSGFHPVEMAGFGIRPDAPLSDLSTEHLDVAMRLWAREAEDDATVFKTTQYEGRVINRIVPAPYTRPLPPLMGVGSRESSIMRAAHQGWPIFFLTVGVGDDFRALVKRVRLYRTELAAAGHTTDVVEACLRWTTSHTILTVVAETDEQAQKEALVALEGHQRNLDRQTDLIAQAYRAAEIDPPVRPRFPPATTREFIDMACIIGSPDTVAAKIQPLADLGIGVLNTSFNLGMPQDAERRRLTEKWMRLFAAEVAPRFHSLPDLTDPLGVDLDALTSEGAAPDQVIRQVV